MKSLHAFSDTVISSAGCVYVQWEPLSTLPGTDDSSSEDPTEQSCISQE